MFARFYEAAIGLSSKGKGKKREGGEPDGKRFDHISHQKEQIGRGEKEKRGGNWFRRLKIPYV